MEFPITAPRLMTPTVAALESKAAFAFRKDPRTGGLMGVGALAISVITTKTTRSADDTGLLG
jgi:hypothetical protein